MSDRAQAIGIIRLQRCQAESAYRLIREYLGPDDPTVAEVYREIDRQLVILGNHAHDATAQSASDPNVKLY